MYHQRRVIAPCFVTECQKAASAVGYGSCSEATAAALQAVPDFFMAATVSQQNA